MKHAVLFPAVALSLAACQDPIQPEVRGLASPPMFSTTSSTGIPVTDLGTLGGTFSQASGINELGQVVGTSTTDTEPDALVRARAFLWTEQGGMIDLGTLGGVSEGGAINNRGQVVGSSLNASDTRHAFFWDRATGMIDLGSLAGPLGISRATAINEHGQVVGESDVVLNNGLRHAFLWTKEGGMIDLGTGGGVEGQATDINARGDVVGWTVFPLPSGERLFFSRAVLWTRNEGSTILGTLGGHSFAEGVNERGQVVGRSALASGELHAFLWTKEDGMTDLGTLGRSSRADGVSNHVHVVGVSRTPSPGSRRHAFLRTPKDGMIDLGTLGGERSFAFGVNSQGQAVGYRLTALGETRATRWTTR